jgi:precorrin-6A synthase
MRKIFVIGIGVGDPDHMTIQAIKALNQVDVFFIPDKGAEKAALRDLRTTICERFIAPADYRTIDVDIPQRATSGDYLAGVDEWHGRLADIYRRLFEHELSAPFWCGAIPRSTTARCGSSNAYVPEGSCWTLR